MPFHYHGLTVPQPQHCIQAEKHSRRHVGGWMWSVGSLPPCQHGSKPHFYKVAYITEQSLPSVCERWDCRDNLLCLCFQGLSCKLSRESYFTHNNPSECGHAHISVLAGQGHILPAQGHTCVHVGDSKCCKSSFLPISTLENYLTTINMGVLVVYNSSAVMCQDKKGPENSKKIVCIFSSQLWVKWRFQTCGMSLLGSCLK